MTPVPDPFLSHCVSIDLEVDPKTARLFGFAAVRGKAALVHKGGALDPALDRLEAFCEGSAYLVGHNILRHDLPHLVANRARLAALGAAPVDTLWLNPLAFPRNPYHHLVKHYQDGRLQAGHVNDPEQDARLIHDGMRWRIEDASGVTIARLSRAFAPPEGSIFLRGEVAAVMVWRRTNRDGDGDFDHHLRRDVWEVVLPELVFEGGG